MIFVCILGVAQVYSNNKSDFPAQSFGPLKFDVDICQFDGPVDSTTVEIIYSVFLTKENITRVDNENETTLFIDLRISDKSGKLITNFSENKTVSL